MNFCMFFIRDSGCPLSRMTWFWLSSRKWLYISISYQGTNTGCRSDIPFTASWYCVWKKFPTPFAVDSSTMNEPGTSGTVE